MDTRCWPCYHGRGLYAPILALHPLGAVSVVETPAKPMLVACTDVRGDEVKLHLSAGNAWFDRAEVGHGAGLVARLMAHKTRGSSSMCALTVS